MTNDMLHRFSAFVDLTLRERAALGDMIGSESSFRPTELIQMEGHEATGLFFLHEGWVLSSIIHPNGARQVLKVHRSGDLMGMLSLPSETAVESLVTLRSARVSVIPLSKFGALLAAFPRLGAVLLLIEQEERIVLTDRLAISGRLGAKHSVAALLLLMFEGQPPSDEVGVTLHIPLTQTQIADVLSLSPVHVNRVLSALEAEGLVRRDRRDRHTYELLDVSRLKRFVGMPARVRRRSPSWLPPATS